MAIWKISKIKSLLLIFFLIALDQLVKWAVFNYGWLETFTNPGIIFGISASPPLWLFILILLSLIIWFLTTDNGLTTLGLSWILAGGISNIVDRLLLERAVRDFYLLKISAFNLADVFIVIGVILIVWHLIFKPD